MYVHSNEMGSSLEYTGSLSRLSLRVQVDFSLQSVTMEWGYNIKVMSLVLHETPGHHICIYVSYVYMKEASEERTDESQLNVDVPCVTTESMLVLCYVRV